MEFEDSIPQDLAIDSCRRYLYWTNSALSNPTIERARIEDKKHEVLVKDDLFIPAGIAIDELTQRIYWADMREGIYYRIESTNFKGEEREVLHEGTHQKPFGLAVDKESIYWTDVIGNGLWRISKNAEDGPEKLLEFEEKPMGLVVKNSEWLGTPDCNTLLQKLVNRTEDSDEYFDVALPEVPEEIQCLNNGIATENGCKCRRGFIGKNCESSLCYNYCLHGDCHFSSLGYPQCHCPTGFFGKRCERNVCDGFCLNDGKCKFNMENKWGAVCLCPSGFMGARCEVSVDPAELCNIFCDMKVTDVLVDHDNSFLCR